MGRDNVVPAVSVSFLISFTDNDEARPRIRVTHRDSFRRGFAPCGPIREIFDRDGQGETIKNESFEQPKQSFLAVRGLALFYGEAVRKNRISFERTSRVTPCASVLPKNDIENSVARALLSGVQTVIFKCVREYNQMIVNEKRCRNVVKPLHPSLLRCNDHPCLAR